MKTSIRSILIIILACTFAGQALAQTVQIGSASGAPGDTVSIPITYTAGPSPARDVTAIQVILGFSESYDDVDSTLGAPLCGGDVAPLAAELCQWGSPGQPLLYQMTQVSATPYPSAVIARINFTIPATAVPGTVDLLISSSSLIGDAGGELDPPVPVLSGSITVNNAVKLDQTITGFAADPVDGTVFGTSTLSATASSGLAVTFGSSTTGVCIVAGSTVTYLAAGTCTVTADQAGDDNYNAAPQITLGIIVTEFQAQPIPTLSQWGLALLLLLMLSTGGIVIRRKDVG